MILTGPFRLGTFYDFKRNKTCHTTAYRKKQMAECKGWYFPLSCTTFSPNLSN